jgi:hypothetical protein
MKLYTEAEILNYLTNHKSTITRYDLQNIPPIELPSDEQIEKANPFVFGSKHLGTRDMDIWTIGAQWMRDKIQGGNK